MLQTLSEKMPSLSKGHQRIAAYILKNPGSAAHMTASRLGGTVGASEATVVRFAAGLGYGGYPAMQKALQEELRGRLSSLQRMDGGSWRAAFLSDIESLRRTIDSFREDDFNAAVEALAAARSVYIVGARSSAALASFLAFYLRLMLPDVRLVGAAEETSMIEQLLRAGPEDAVVGLSFPRYSHRTVRSLQFASERGARNIVLTDRPDAPAAAHAAHLLTAPSSMASFVDSLVAPMSLLNALIAALGARRKDDAQSAFALLEDIWEQNREFEK
jgi:DNA-binding MurR/RpiR family transcriptional regulator